MRVIIFTVTLTTCILTVAATSWLLWGRAPRRRKR